MDKLIVCQWSDGEWCFKEDLEIRKLLRSPFNESDFYIEVKFNPIKHNLAIHSEKSRY